MKQGEYPRYRVHSGDLCRCLVRESLGMGSKLEVSVQVTWWLVLDHLDIAWLLDVSLGIALPLCTQWASDPQTKACFETRGKE